MQPEILSYSINQLTRSQHLQIDQVVVELHKKPCLNRNVINKSIEDIVDIFWTEFKNFQSNRYPFNCPGRFFTKDPIGGCSHIWNEMYSLPYTQVRGFVACRVTSKHLVIGAGERSWSDVMMIKNGKIQFEW